MSRRSKRGRYFEDFAVGDEFTTGGRTIGEWSVEAFAGLTGDFSYVHIDAEAVKDTLYGERIVHGLLSLSIMQGLMWQTGYDVDTGVATLGWENVKFPAPARLGDTVCAHFCIKAARLSRSRPGLGIITEDCRLVNQEGNTLVTGDHVLMVHCRQTD
jgi:acyl dehydratase